MTWDSLVIIVLCVLNFLLLLALIKGKASSRSREAPLRELAIKNNTQSATVRDMAFQIQPGSAPPKKDDSVILMTAERDGIILGDQDD